MIIRSVKQPASTGSANRKLTTDNTRGTEPEQIQGTNENGWSDSNPAKGYESEARSGRYNGLLPEAAKSTSHPG
jgi:hypothetical protein